MTVIPHMNLPIVDVRECAEAHLQAIKVPEAANQRFINACEEAWFSDLIAILANKYGPEGWPITTVKADPP